MERLTCKTTKGENVLTDLSDFDKYGNVKYTPTCSNVCGKYNSCLKCQIQKAFNKLAEYEDAEEQGLLFRLPCKVGDTIYLVDFDENEYDEAIVETIEFGRNGFMINSDCEIRTYLSAEYLFLTKEEAEAALQKMQEGE